jgi:N-acetyl-anhydromuramyl-L-alanine amidase AmpD
MGLQARLALALSLALGLASCASNRSAEPAKESLSQESLSSALTTSAGAAQVPRDLLVAIAHVEDGLAMPRHREVVDIDNDVPAAGPMQLRRGKLDTLRRGAELVAASEVELRSDSDLALRAGALVLAEVGTKTNAVRDDLASWSRAIEEMSGYADDAHRRAYAHRVFATLARGGSFVGRDGEMIELLPHDLPPSLALDLSTELHTLAEAQYDGAEWIPTSCAKKCGLTREGNTVSIIVIHDTEGSWDASVATLQNDPNKSVQYIVGTDGHVAQFVTEETTAWHAGNIDVNRRSIGIEHVGYAKQPFPEAQYAASAKLVDHLAAKYGVARDRDHIIGHDQVPNGTKIPIDSPPCSMSPQDCWDSPNYGGANQHHDPGIWEWATYMPRIGGEAKCNDVTALWQCTSERSTKYRCEVGKVVVEACAAGCDPGSDGKDAACKVAPQTFPTPASTSQPPGATAPPPPAPEASAGEGAANDGGCAQGAQGRSRRPAWGLGAGGLLVALSLLRRRRRPG